jgi:anti-anti-sigma regulatory factor
MGEREEKLKREITVLDAINTVFREALLCDTEEDMAKKCLAVAEELTGSSFGFIGEMNAAGLFDTIALSDPGWEACRMSETNKVTLLKNMEMRGFWGRVLKDGKSLIVNDPATHPDSTGVPEGYPPLTSFLGVPLKQGGKTTGMIALANREEGYTDDDREAIEALSVAFVEAMRNKRTDLTMKRLALEMLELSTPVLQIWEGVVVAPLIGTLDSERTQQFMERLLNEIVKTKSPVALIDITGVPTIDTQTGQHLIEAISAARLLGTEVILTGVRPAIAQTLVHLGIDLSDFITKSSLAAGLNDALYALNLRVVPKAVNT